MPKVEAVVSRKKREKAPGAPKGTAFAIQVGAFGDPALQELDLVRLE